MNNEKKIYATSIASIILSVTALSISLYCNVRISEPIKWDMLGIFAGILSVLVTILMGWQLYNAISFENRMNKLKKEIKIESKQQSEKNMNEIVLKSDDIQAQVLYRESMLEFSLKQYELSFQSAILSIEKASNNHFVSKEEFEIIESQLCKVISEINNNGKEFILDNYVKDRYISIIKSAELKHGNDILKYVLNIKTN